MWMIDCASLSHLLGMFLSCGAMYLLMIVSALHPGSWHHKYQDLIQNPRNLDKIEDLDQITDIVQSWRIDLWILLADALYVVYDLSLCWNLSNTRRESLSKAGTLHHFVITLISWITLPSTGSLLVMHLQYEMDPFWLILGSYTPIVLVCFIKRGHSVLFGYVLLTSIWTCAIVGTLVKALVDPSLVPLSFTVGTYLFMGWLCIIAYKPIMKSVPSQGNNNNIITSII